MAENVTEKKDCLKCGAPFRPGSLYCYGCGSSVTDSDDFKIPTNGNGKEDFSPDKKLVSEESYNDFPDDARAIEKPVGTPLETPVAASVANKERDENKKLVVQKETKLKTAASLRKRPKPAERKPVEIVWEQPESSSHTWFVLVSLILVFFAVCMLIAMLYFR